MADNDDFDWRDAFDIEPEPNPRPSEYWGSDHLRFAKTLHERADFRRALHKALQAIDSWPTNPEPYVIAGDALSMIDEYEIDYLNPVVFSEKAPEDFYKSALLHEPEDMLRAEILIKLAFIHEERGEFALAADRCEEISLYMGSDEDRCRILKEIVAEQSAGGGGGSCDSLADGRCEPPAAQVQGEKVTWASAAADLRVGIDRGGHAMADFGDGFAEFGSADDAE